MNPNLPPMHRLGVRALPDDMMQKVLDQLIEGTPPEDLCGRLYERCLLLLGSGQCPPDHPVWAQACRRFGLLQKGQGLETWQATFRAFCTQAARLPPAMRATLWKYVRGEGAAVLHFEYAQLRDYVLSRTFHWPPQPTVVIQALHHFGALDMPPPQLMDLVAWNNVNAVLQLVDGHPRWAVSAMVRAILHNGLHGPEMMTALLASGVPVDFLVRDRETLLHYAAASQKGSAVEVLLQAGADQTARNAQGRTAAEVARYVVIQECYRRWRVAGNQIPRESLQRTRFLGNLFSTATLLVQRLLRPLWPEAAAQWMAMEPDDRLDAVLYWEEGRSVRDRARAQRRPVRVAQFNLWYRGGPSVPGEQPADAGRRREALVERGRQNREQWRQERRD